MQLIFVLILLLQISTAFMQDNSLEKLLAKAAGIYQTPTAISYNLSRTVLIASGDHRFFNHLSNWKCFMDRLNMKALVFSYDLKLHDFINRNTNENQTIFSYYYVPDNHTYHNLSNPNLFYIQMALKLNYDVFFMDTDSKLCSFSCCFYLIFIFCLVAVVRDPLPSILYNNVDYVFTKDKICAR